MSALQKLIDFVPVVPVSTPQKLQKSVKTGQIFFRFQTPGYERNELSELNRIECHTLKQVLLNALAFGEPFF